MLTRLTAGVDILGTRAAREERIVPMTAMNYVTSGYFQVLRMPLRSGREIDDRDTGTSLPIAIVNNTFARKYLRGLPVLGSHIKLHGDGADRQIVGIIEDVRQQPGFGNYAPLDSVPAVYVPATQLPDQTFQLVHTWFSPVWVVRGGGSVAKMIEAVQRAVESVDRFCPSRISTLWKSTRTWPSVHKALGATVPAAIWTATKPGMLLSLMGVLIGTGLALVSTRVLKSSLYGVQTLDPATFISAAAGLVFIGTLASLIPALRLVRLSPSETLGQE